MKRLENDCVGCPQNMGCLGSACPYQNVIVFECDECGDEVEVLYKVEFQGTPYYGKEVCEDCLKGMFKRITYDSYAEEIQERKESELWH